MDAWVRGVIEGINDFCHHELEELDFIGIDGFVEIKSILLIST